MKRLFTSTLALVLVFSLAAPVGAQAQTTAELQAQISSLLNLITQLQRQLNSLQNGGVVVPNPGFVFTSDLTIGSRGMQVEELQKFLVARGFLVMPAGVAFGYFGPLTQAALGRFQASQGISPTAGYFGPITRTRINALIVVVPPVTPPATTTPGGITTPGVEGIMSVTSSNVGIRSTIYEGETRVPVLGMDVEARLSDIAVQRVKVNLGDSSLIYNRILSKIYVTDGNNILAESDLNSNTVVREGSTYYITITGFNFIVPRGSERNIVIKADVRPSIDSTDLGIARTIALANNGIRGIDGAGIDHYSPTSGSSVSRSVNVQRDLAETASLRLSLNNSTPRAQHVVASSGSSDNELDKLTLLTFDVRAERDDVTVTDMVVNIAKSGTGSANASSTVYLYDGNTEIDNANVSNGTATFNDLDLTISQNATKTLTVRTDIRNANGTLANFVASVNASGITAENRIGDSLSSGSISGGASGYTIGVRNIGPEITLVSKAITTSGVPQGSGNNESTSALTATFNVKVRAVGGDIILGTLASTTPAFSDETSFGVYRNGILDDSIGSIATSTSYSVPSGATTAGITNGFRIPEGSEVTIPVTFQILGRRAGGSALPSGLYSIGFEGFAWVSQDTSGTTSFMMGDPDWRTSDVSFP